MKQQKWTIAGLGSTGLSVLDYCLAQGIDTIAYDRQITAERLQALQTRYPQTEWMIGDEAVLAQALAKSHTLVLSPGISRRLNVIEDFERQGGRVTGDVGILSDLLREKNSKIIAITGSNGKTTVTSLVGHLCTSAGLDAVVAGNIGTPVLQTWLERQKQLPDVWVLELSSFQLETTENLAATAAVCLNISEDHLDRYNNLLDYAHSKDAIFNGVGVQVINQDDVFCCAMKRENSTILTFSLNDGNADYSFQSQTGALLANQETFLTQDAISLQGKHNIANVLAAMALCEAVGIERELLVQHIVTFKGLPHRVEKVGEKNGIVFIDDSKGTNVGATEAAIAGLDAPIVLIAGGQGKGQDFSPLRAALKNKVRGIFLIGEDAPQLAQDLQGCGVKPEFCIDLPEAVERAYATAQRGDIVLLSPACASFDMFRGYAHRAEVFIEAFHRLS